MIRYFTDGIKERRRY